MAKNFHVGLFVTCLADLLRPSVGFAALKLLQQAGCRVACPAAQTCCGQPAYNAGDARNARALAKRVIEAFEGFDYVVAPSGSCAGMLRRHYPQLLADDAAWAGRAARMAEKTYELVSFLTDVLGVTDTGACCGEETTATYHDSCSGRREMGVTAQPRALLAKVKGLRLTEAADAEVCCGFGGMFCVKYPEISARMAQEKAQAVADTGAQLLLGGDLGCLMNIAGDLSRRGVDIEVRHVAELLAGMTDAPPIAGRPGGGRD